MENKQPQIPTPGGITPDMIKAAKEKYGEGKVKIASLPLDDEGNESLDVLIRVPDRKILSEFEKWGDRDPDKSKEILLNACLLSSKDQVKADTALFMTACTAIAEIIPIRKATLKNC